MLKLLSTILTIYSLLLRLISLLHTSCFKKMSEWFDTQKQSISRISNLLQERIDKENPRRNLTAEETKRLNKLKVVKSA